MLGAIGFMCAALAVGAFAYTAERAYGAFLRDRERWLFSFAFALLAACMTVWAAASLVATQGVVALPPYMYMSDLLLVVATMVMVTVALPNATRSPLVVASLAALGAVMVVARIVLIPVTAYGNNEGMLVFGLEGIMRDVVTAGFLFVWLPAVYVVAKSMQRNPLIAPLANPFVVLFAVMVLLSLGLVVSFRPLIITGLFVVITVLFLLATFVNVKIAQATSGKRSKK